MIDVERIRADLPSATSSAYLNAGTFGPLPRPAYEAMQVHLARAYEVGRIGGAFFAEFGELMASARAGFAAHVGADPDDVALTRSTTDGVNLVVWGLDWRAGDEVVTTSAEHPGITAPLDELARRRGVRIRVAAPTREAIAAELSERTRLVAISHVLWTTGDVLPLAEIAADARAAGALLLADGAQSGGAIVLDAPACGADFYTLSGQKWLLGPSGTGALYVRRGRLADLGTAFPWYLSTNRRPGQPPEPWPNARRLDAGSGTITAYVGSRAALAWRAEVVGDEAGVARAHALAVGLRERLAAAPGVRVVEAPVPSSLVAFEVEGADVNEVVAGLGARGVLVRSIPGPNHVRASVGFWNVEDDLDRLTDGLRP